MHMRAEQTKIQRHSLIERLRAHASTRVQSDASPEGGVDPQPSGVTAERTRQEIGGGGATGGLGRIANRAALVLLALAVVYRVILTLRGWPMVESDEAIIGLMARHILHGQFDYWFWGQQYMGAFQAYVVALFFAAFGSSTLVLRLAILLFTIGFLAAMYVLGRAAYGPVAGLLTLAWLVIGPSMSLLREQTAIGGYQDMLLFGSLVLVGVWLRLRRPEALPRTRREWIRALLLYAGIGVAGGIGLWSDLLIVPVLVMGAFALLAGRTRELFSFCGLALVLGFFVGGFPYISYNITYKNATYKEIVRESHPNGSMQLLPDASLWVEQTGEALSVGVPVMLGSPHVCINAGSLFPAYPPAQAEINHALPGACDDANGAFSLAAIFIYLTVAWQLAVVFLRWLPSGVASVRRRVRGRVRERRRAGSASTRVPAPDDTTSSSGVSTETQAVAFAPEEVGRYWLRLMMLGVAAMTLGLYSMNQGAQIYQLTSSRYLLLLYLTAPLLIGGLWEFAAPLLPPALAAAMSRLGASVPESAAISRATLVRGGQRVRAVLASLALVALLALSIAGGVFTVAFAFSSPLFGLPEPPLDHDLIAFLDAHHITAYYSDYWTCYHIMFETSERITCAVRGQNGEVGLDLINNRNDLYVSELAQVRFPAYILPAGTPEDRAFAQEAEAQNLPHDGYQRVVLGGYAIYYHP